MSRWILKLFIMGTAAMGVGLILEMVLSPILLVAYPGWDELVSTIPNHGWVEFIVFHVVGWILVRKPIREIVG